MGAREKLPKLPPDTEEIPLGDRIRARRWYMKIWLEDLAERVDYTASHLGQIERGQHNPSDELFEAICRELEITEQELRSAPREQIQSWIDQGKRQTRKGKHARRVNRLQLRTTQFSEATQSFSSNAGLILAINRSGVAHLDAFTGAEVSEQDVKELLQQLIKATDPATIWTYSYTVDPAFNGLHTFTVWASPAPLPPWVRPSKLAAGERFEGTKEHDEARVARELETNSEYWQRTIDQLEEAQKAPDEKPHTA